MFREIVQLFIIINILAIMQNLQRTKTLKCLRASDQ